MCKKNIKIFVFFRKKYAFCDIMYAIINCVCEIA